MSNQTYLTRRRLFKGLLASAMVVAIRRFSFAAILSGPANAYAPWVPIGSISQFREGETRLVTFTNPHATPTEGKTSEAACWVRHIAGKQFQVFAANCAHEGCAVRWSSKSGLFTCSCQRGEYYRNGARASGPPGHGLFEYPYEIDNGVLTIQAGARKPGPSAAIVTGERYCA